jgi:NAD(P)-dependent dehydrogenase (short-subunit alcohol dehydrogenase family)
MCKALAEHGAKVAVIDLRLEEAEKVSSEIVSAGGHAIAVSADVLSRESLLAAKQTIHDRLGLVEILINGAGGNRPQATATPQQPFFDIPLEAIQWVFNLNCLGTILPSQIFVPDMIQLGRGVVINITSMAAIRPLTGVVAYGAAKAAVANFTQWLAVHLAQNYTPKIRVNAIAPGFFLTNQNRYLLVDEAGNPTPRGQTILAHTPAGRYGDPSDLLSTLLWLVDDQSAFITGAIIPVDGGFSAFAGV